MGRAPDNHVQKSRLVVPSAKDGKCCIHLSLRLWHQPHMLCWLGVTAQLLGRPPNFGRHAMFRGRLCLTTSLLCMQLQQQAAPDVEPGVKPQCLCPSLSPESRAGCAC